MSPHEILRNAFIDVAEDTGFSLADVLRSWDYRIDHNQMKVTVDVDDINDVMDDIREKLTAKGHESTVEINSDKEGIITLVL